MEGIGNASIIELVQVGFVAAAVVLHSLLLSAARTDLAGLIRKGAGNGRLVQARADIRKYRVLLGVQAALALPLINQTLRIPTNPFTEPADTVFAGLCYMAARLLLAYLAIHQYRTRAKLLRKIVRWTPRIR
jgi:hypothetical protein